MTYRVMRSWCGFFLLISPIYATVSYVRYDYFGFILSVSGGLFALYWLIKLGEIITCGSWLPEIPFSSEVAKRLDRVAQMHELSGGRLEAVYFCIEKNAILDECIKRGGELLMRRNETGQEIYFGDEIPSQEAIDEFFGDDSEEEGV